jgi:hypothetical protein
VLWGSSDGMVEQAVRKRVARRIVVFLRVGMVWSYLLRVLYRLSLLTDIYFGKLGS